MSEVSPLALPLQGLATLLRRRTAEITRLTPVG
jgi:hypothetical protein